MDLIILYKCLLGMVLEVELRSWFMVSWCSTLIHIPVLSRSAACHVVNSDTDHGNLKYTGAQLNLREHAFLTNLIWRKFTLLFIL